MSLNVDSRARVSISIAILLAALVCLMFSNGRFPVAICAWLGPLFMIRFTRTGKGWIRLPIAYVGLSFAFGYQFYGMTPFGSVAYLIFCAAIGLTLLLPYAADRYLALRWGGVARTLIFPLALVLSEYLVSFGPFCTWGSVAYSQYEQLTLLQILSVTGLYGITFLIGWFAAAANSLWEADFAVLKVQRESVIFALVFTGVLLYGGCRLALFPPRSQTIRLASITRPDETRFPYPPGVNLNRRVRTGQPLTDAETEQLHQRSNSIADFMLGRADLEAQAGAKVITFGEFNFPVLKQYEADLVQRGSELARARGIYIALPMAVFNIGQKRPLEDKLVMIEPSGRTVWEYLKTQMPPGLEVAILSPSTGRLPVMETPYGRMGSAIAFDMDFPNFLLQAGRKHADLMIVPENEYPEIDPMHSHMARYRAVENGFNLLLHASQSLSLASDYQGRIYGLMDHYHAEDRVLVAQLPIQGVTTIYSLGGYLFPVICVVGFFFALLATIIWRRRQPQPTHSA